MSKKSVLGIDITIDNKDDILEHIKKYLDKIPNSKFQIPNKKIKPFVIFTPNPEIITYAQKDDKFKEIVNSGQINIPDGMGIVWALKKLYKLNIERLSGVDLMFDLCGMAEKEGFTVGLIGGRGGVAVEARECLLEKYPNLRAWAMEGPLILDAGDASSGSPNKGASAKSGALGGAGERQDPQIIIDRIIQEKTDILFVALGFPKQEYFIRNIKDQISKIKNEKPIVLMAVGGTFDYLAGKARRAPEWVRNSGFEWLYRLVREPWRLQRQIKGAEFFLQVLLR